MNQDGTVSQSLCYTHQYFYVGHFMKRKRYYLFPYLNFVALAEFLLEMQED